MLKIIVAVKRVVDYSVRIRVKSDGSGIETDRVKMSMNPFDEIALEAALRLRDSGLSIEIIAVSVGNETQEVLRHALALGANRAIGVSGWGEQAPQPLQVARALNAILAQESADENPVQAVFLGKQAIDTDNHQTGQMLAGLWRVAQATGVSKIDPLQEDERLTGFRVHCEVDEGLEELILPLPCVLTADLRLSTPRYPSLPQIMQAKKKTIIELSALALGISLEPQRHICSVQSPKLRRAGKKLKNVAELVQQLTEESKVL